MNEKQKAESYVRSKCPELMELSFGCLLKNKYTQLDYDRLNILVENEGKNIMAFRPSFKVCGLFTRETFEIIGHPIELHHWLMVLEGNEYHMYKRANYLQVVVGDVDTGTIEHSFSFNLITGQPATEDDYQAFNEIVGI